MSPCIPGDHATALEHVDHAPGARIAQTQAALEHRRGGGLHFRDQPDRVGEQRILVRREFPQEVEVWNTAGALVYKVASLPLPARVPLGGVQTGPRQICWMANQPATIVWVEALDGGNPKEKVPHRDRIFAMRAPFKGTPVEIFKTEERFAGIQFGSNFALVEDLHRVTRLLRTFRDRSIQAELGRQADLEPQSAGSL